MEQLHFSMSIKVGQCVEVTYFVIVPSPLSLYLNGTGWL